MGLNVRAVPVCRFRRQRGGCVDMARSGNVRLSHMRWHAQASQVTDECVPAHALVSACMAIDNRMRSLIRVCSRSLWPAVVVPAQALLLPGAEFDAGEVLRVAAWWECAVQVANAGRRAHDAGGRLPVRRASISARLRAVCRRLPQVVATLAQAVGAPARAVLRCAAIVLSFGLMLMRGWASSSETPCLRGRAGRRFARGS